MILTLCLRTISYGLVAVINLASLSLISSFFNLNDLGVYFILITVGGFVSLLDLGAGFSAVLVGRQRELDNNETLRHLKNALSRIGRLGPILLMSIILFSYPFASYILKNNEFEILLSIATVVIGGFIICLFSPFINLGFLKAWFRN